MTCIFTEIFPFSKPQTVLAPLEASADERKRRAPSFPLLDLAATRQKVNPVTLRYALKQLPNPYHPIENPELLVEGYADTLWQDHPRLVEIVIQKYLAAGLPEVREITAA